MKSCLVVFKVFEHFDQIQRLSHFQTEVPTMLFFDNNLDWINF